MAGLAGGNVWTWPDPVRGDQGFESPALSVWQTTYDQSADPKWYDNWNQYQQYQGNEATWRDYDLGGQYKNALYSFTKQSYDPYNKVQGYSPQSGSTYARIIGDIQGYLDREFPELSDFSGSSGQFGQGANSTANLGGDWAGVDAWNEMILSAQSKVQAETGVFVPGNLIKAVMRLESNGEMKDDPGGAIGAMQIMPFWGETYGDLHNPATNIYAGVSILANNYKDGNPNTGEASWEWAAKRYLGLGGPDSYGTDSTMYWDTVSRYWQQLDSAVRGSNGNGTIPISSYGGTIIAIAQQYVGVIPYPEVWTGNPGKGDDPMRYGGWDCSGFVYWLDQNYGTGAIPQGSHYQYQYAQQTGQLFSNRSALQVGDLVFFDTGITSGGGAELNHASHVAIYAGNNMMIHSANPSQGTIISDMTDPYYNSKFIGGMHTSWSGNAGSATGYGTNAFDAITGGVPFPVTQEIGKTAWSESADGAAMYGYGPDYGIEGHPGIDVGAPLNTNLYSPVTGRVVIAGGGDYFQDERYGTTPQTGELLIEMANGDQVILGHMSQIDVKVGDTVTAGQSVGFSGTYNGAHVHVEYRRIGAPTTSGYQAVDPRLALSGMFTGQFGQQGTQQYKAPADNWAAFMRATAQGLPVTGYSSGPQGATFHNWLKSGMLNQWKTPTNQPGGNTIAGAWGVTPYSKYTDIVNQAINPTGTGA